MKFLPKVKDYSDDELIGIANSTTEYWQQEMLDDARDELDRRGISKAYESALLAQWAEEQKQYETEEAKRLDENAAEGYGSHDKLMILLLAPLILIGSWNYGNSLSELKAGNYRLKYRQRMSFLLSGVALWVLVFYIIGLTYV
ncbi:hypothetical protein [uncultured Alistipes sp.]|jgi:hypothetical protein|uniref:hypothetical protein n=1 Tax=uncultured Alistipes sp. TaxID=538949 RepID=UPI0025E35056|nr:hypothetical protein [uncultured Alistipes sp.]